jgi:hypothetical protein
LILESYYFHSVESPASTPESSNLFFTPASEAGAARPREPDAHFRQPHVLKKVFHTISNYGMNIAIISGGATPASYSRFELLSAGRLKRLISLF